MDFNEIHEGGEEEEVSQDVEEAKADKKTAGKRSIKT